MTKKCDKRHVVGYWTIITNVGLVLFSFWMGLAVQDMIAQKNANVSSVLAKVEYINRVKPSIDSLNIQYHSLIKQFIKDSIIWQRDTIPNKNIIDSINSKTDSLLMYYTSIINTTKEVIYYFDESDLDLHSDSSLISKIGDLYDNKIIVDYCQHDELYTLRKLFPIGDPSYYEYDISYVKSKMKPYWISLYNSPEYISLMGVNVNHEKSIKYFEDVLERFQEDFSKGNNVTELDIKFSTLRLALNIHNELNTKLIYKQPNIPFRTIFFKAPWIYFFIGAIVVCLIITFGFLRSVNGHCFMRKKGETDSTVKSETTGNKAEESMVREELETIKGRLQDIEEKLNKEINNNNQLTEEQPPCKDDKHSCDESKNSENT